jgi:hypothetical protein
MIEYFDDNCNKLFKNVKYLYYGGNTVVPFFEEIENKGLVKFSDILNLTPDVCPLSKNNIYYKNMYKNTLENFSNYFGSYNKKINKEEYYTFFNSFSKNNKESSRTYNDILFDAEYIEKNKYEADKFIHNNSDLIFKDNDTTVHAPYNMDCMRILMNETFSCFLTDIDGIYTGFLDENAIFYIIQDYSGKYINLNHIFKKDLECFIHRSGIVMLEDNFFRPDKNGYPSNKGIDKLKLDKVEKIINKVKPSINKHYSKNKDKFFIKNNNELFFNM